jgi:hypothetical protein
MISFTEALDNADVAAEAAEDLGFGRRCFEALEWSKWKGMLELHGNRKCA